MTERTLKRLVHTAPQSGTGILHPFPSQSLPHLDPFVFLDTGAPKNIGKGHIFVGPHPHRGVQPVSLLFRGRIEHRDSLGNHRTVRSGGIQWLVSGAGALHEEVLHGDDEGVFHMAQLWINVPRALKMAPPEHHALPAERVPEITSLGDGATVRLYAGSLEGEDGPAPLPTPVLVAHVILGPRAQVSIPVPTGWTTAFTVVAGAVSALGAPILEPGDTVVYDDDGETMAVSSDEGGQLLLICGEPIGESIAMGGGFVMNSPQEIEVAWRDYREGSMGDLTSSR